MNSEGFELLQGSRLSAPQRMKGNLPLEGGIRHNQESINTKKKKNLSGKAAENNLKESSVQKVHKNISPELLHWNLVKVHELLIVGFLCHSVGAICKPTSVVCVLHDLVDKLLFTDS